MFQLWSECGAKMLFQAPNQGVAKCGEMRSPYSKLRVLTTREPRYGMGVWELTLIWTAPPGECLIEASGVELAENPC